jgi:DEAD/DEAH box helicase domain-containing protein
MSRRRSIGFELPETPPAAPESQRRSLKPARHHESQMSLLKAEACPACGRDSSNKLPVSDPKTRRASAGEDARPAPQGPYAPEHEAVHASSRLLRRAGKISPGATLEDFFRAQTAIPGREDSLAHMEKIAARESRFAEPEHPLPNILRTAIAEGGVEQLYLHQTASLDAARRGENVVVVTGTASGKTLCYNLPVFETLLQDDQATAFYLFPTKALAQDQLKGAERLAAALPELGRFSTGTYDGDTSTHTRRKLRMEGRLILSNPDMFHAGILPSHTRWARFFMNLRYVVLDEIHSYRGIFGSNVAAVMRRLRRICAHYGSNPVFIASSATIGNPKELAERIFGAPTTLVDEDGSPRGEKLFVFWNPPRLDEKGGERRGANGEAKDLLCDLVKQGRQTICFSRTKVSSELIYRYARDTLQREAPHLAPKLRAYRGGYLPEERREIERQLFSGELMAVSSTNALELGIDIGGLDAALLVGLPPTIASAWQQAGRAGRGERESCAVLVAHNDPVEQYLMRRPEFFFRQNPEKAVIDHANPFILLPQLRCAAYELPLETNDRELFGDLTDGIIDILEQRGDLRRAGEQVFYASNGYPAGDVNLRQSVLDTVSIVQVPGEYVIGNVDLLGAYQLVFPEAIYLHEGETYFVRELDLEQKVAFVERRGVDYYTQPITEQKIRLDKEQESVAIMPAGAKAETLHLGFGDVTVSKTTFAFKKVKFGSLDSLGWGKLDLPWHDLETRALWIALTENSRKALDGGGHKLHEALAGLKNLLISALPLFAMCDRADLGAVVDASNLGTTALFVYDRFHGGLGYSRVGFDDLDSLLAACLDMLEVCACEDGCPACVGLPNRVPGQSEDPDLNPDFAVPGKDATRALLKILTGKEVTTENLLTINSNS